MEYVINAKRILQFLAFAFTLAAVLAILILPSYITVESDSKGNETVSTSTVLAETGPVVLAILAVPTLIAAVPLLLRGRTWQPGTITSALLLVGFAIVSGLTIGFYFVPAAILALVATFLPPRRNSQ